MTQTSDPVTLTLHQVAHHQGEPEPLSVDELDDHIRRLVPKLKWRLQYNGTMATTDIYAAVWERVWKVQLADAKKLTKPYIARAIRNLILDQKRAQGRRTAEGFARADSVDVDSLHRSLTPSGERMVELQSDAMAAALIVEALRQGVGMPSFMRQDTRINHARVFEAILDNPSTSDAEIARSLDLSPKTYHSMKKRLLQWLKPIVRNALTTANALDAIAEQVLDSASTDEVDKLKDKVRSSRD